MIIKGPVQLHEPDGQGLARPLKLAPRDHRIALDHLLFGKQVAQILARQIGHLFPVRRCVFKSPRDWILRRSWPARQAHAHEQDEPQQIQEQQHVACRNAQPWIARFHTE